MVCRPTVFSMVLIGRYAIMEWNGYQKHMVRSLIEAFKRGLVFLVAPTLNSTGVKISMFEFKVPTI